jgi:hypothetical protein
MTDVTLTIRRLGALDGRSPERVRPTGHNACGNCQLQRFKPGSLQLLPPRLIKAHNRPKSSSRVVSNSARRRKFTVDGAAPNAAKIDHCDFIISQCGLLRLIDQRRHLGFRFGKRQAGEINARHLFCPCHHGHVCSIASSPGCHHPAVPLVVAFACHMPPPRVTIDPAV